MYIDEKAIRQRVADDIYSLSYELSYNKLAKKLNVNRKTLFKYRDQLVTITVPALGYLTEVSGKSLEYYLYGKSMKNGYDVGDIIKCSSVNDSIYVMQRLEDEGYSARLIHTGKDGIWVEVTGE